MSLSRRLMVCGVVAWAAVSACKSTTTTSAILHNQHENYEMAIEQATISIEEDPNDARAYFELGIAYSNLAEKAEDFDTKKDYLDQAFESFRQAIQLKPDDVDMRRMANDNIKHNYVIHYNAGISEFSDENELMAADEFYLAFIADPRQPKAYISYAKSIYKVFPDSTLFVNRALKSLSRAMTLSEPGGQQYTDALEIYCKILSDQGRETELLERVNELLETNPEKYYVLEDAGYNALDNQNHETAFLLLQRAAKARKKIGEEDWEIYYNLGVLAYQLKDYEKAYDYYMEALSMPGRQDDPVTMRNLMATLYASERYEEAIDWSQKYTTEIQPEDPEGWKILGWAYKKLGKPTEGNKALMKYKELDRRARGGGS
jgi:tetratricopeptide (TPR) repeat protein